MNRQELLEHKKVSAKNNSNLNLVQKGYADGAFISKYLSLNKHQFNTSFYCVYSLYNNAHINFVAVLSYYSDHYILKCSDPYLEGSLNETTLNKLIRSTLDKEHAPYNGKLASSLKLNFGIVPKSTACSFNQNNFTTIGPVCEHIAQFLFDLPSETLNTLYKNYSNSKVKATALKNGKVLDSLDNKFTRYAFKKHLLLEGDKGGGKTYYATQWAKNKEVEQIFIGGHEQFESIDFLGHFIQRKDGSLIWKDGALSQAFRLANKGHKTVLIIDEILRIPKRELNLLISALSPIDENYVLRTGRAVDEKDDIAIEEVLYAPVKNLWIIGTTNVGDSYAVEEIDEALIDRFKPLRKETSANEIQNILIEVAAGKNFHLDVVSKLMAFYKKMTHLKRTKILNHIVNLRHLKEALEFANNELEVNEIIKDSILLWVDREDTGEANAEQLTTVKSVIATIWK